MYKKLVVFDLYNTLIRSKHGNGSSYEDILVELGVERDKIFPFIRDGIMNRDLDLLQVVQNIFINFGLDPELYAKEVKRTCELWTNDNRTEWISQALEFVNALKASDKYTVCLMTNVSRPGWIAVNSEFQLQDIFDYCFVSWREGICKPDPRCWEILLRDSGSSSISPSDCWMIGDRFEDDLMVPRNKGWNAFLIKQGQDNFKKLEELLF